MSSYGLADGVNTGFMALVGNLASAWGAITAPFVRWLTVAADWRLQADGGAPHGPLTLSVVTPGAPPVTATAATWAPDGAGRVTMALPSGGGLALGQATLTSTAAAPVTVEVNETVAFDAGTAGPYLESSALSPPAGVDDGQGARVYTEVTGFTPTPLVAGASYAVSVAGEFNSSNNSACGGGDLCILRVGGVVPFNQAAYLAAAGTNTALVTDALFPYVNPAVGNIAVTGWGVAFDATTTIVVPAAGTGYTNGLGVGFSAQQFGGAVASTNTYTVGIQRLSVRRVA